MSKNQNKKTYQSLNTPTKTKQTTISFKEITSKIDSQISHIPTYLKFEFKFFLFSFSTLISTNVYIHKSYLNNYNFKLITLISLFFFRRVLKLASYHFQLKQHLINPINHIVFIIFIIQIILNTLYVFYDLIQKYSIYSLLPLFYLVLLQIPIFIFDNEKRYEKPPKEMIRTFKKIIYLSLEVCYYGIFIPVFFAVKNNHFFNAFAILIYTFFAWINLFVFLLAGNYFKKCGELHFYTISAGNWKKITKQEMTFDQFSKVKLWNGTQYYEKGAIVEYKEKYYIGLEEKNYVEPNNFYMGILYWLFMNPKCIFGNVMKIQGIITIFQCLFYCCTQYNVFVFNLIIMAWYSFYEIYKMFCEIKKVYNRK